MNRNEDLLLLGAAAVGIVNAMAYGIPADVVARRLLCEVETRGLLDDETRSALAERACIVGDAT